MTNQRSDEQIEQMVENLGPAEKLIDLILNFPDHLWHNRPGVVENGKWRMATSEEIMANKGGNLPVQLRFQNPGPNVSAIVHAYATIADIFKMNEELVARLASYTMVETDWKDMKIVLSAFMLVQNHHGQMIYDEETHEPIFNDDDFREIGEAMVKLYGKRMMNPKMIQRIGVVLNIPEIFEINKRLNFCNQNKNKPFVGRYTKTIKDWLSYREINKPLLEGLVKAGFSNTVKNLSRFSGYKPNDQWYFETLRWPQKQATAGHREIGLTDLSIRKNSFDGLTEQDICKKIIDEKLGYKQVVGMLNTKLTANIFAATMNTMGDKDFVILTPSLEEFGLLKNEKIRSRWQEALKNVEDQRASNIAKNVKSKELATGLNKSADDSLQKTVTEATAEADLHIIFLVDKSGSMQGAIKESVDILTNILQGFDKDKLHIATFDNIGTLIKLKHHSRTGVSHALSSVRAGGGTSHSSGIRAIKNSGVTIPDGADLLIFVVGDGAGERGNTFKAEIEQCGYDPTAFVWVKVSNPTWHWGTGETVTQTAEQMEVNCVTVEPSAFNDVYQTQRTIKAVLDGVPLRTRESWVAKVLRTPMLTKPY